MDPEGEPALAKGITINGTDVLPWVEKYRPQTMAGLIAHKDIAQTIERFIDTGTLPHLLLHGPPGTGKTSTIIACAKKMFGPRYASLCLELNASDARGIDVVREEIKGFASARQLFVSPHSKLIILDEADHMTHAAQFALRRVIENYHANARFCLIGNYAGKIIPALQSRCTRFRFVPLTKEQVTGRVSQICKEEGVEYEEDGLDAVGAICRGDMRMALNILQATSLAFKCVTRHGVYLTTGVPLPSAIDTVLQALLEQPLATGVAVLEHMRAEKGYSLVDILRGLFDATVELKLPRAARQRLMPMLADIEYRLSRGATEKVQEAALVGAFFETRTLMAAVA